MPYRWDQAEGPPPVRRLVLWPHRSLPPQGFAAFILGTFAMLMVPVLGLLGKAALWGVLPFALGALALTWVLLRRSYRDGQVTETLRSVPRPGHAGARRPRRAPPRLGGQPLLAARRDAQGRPTGRELSDAEGRPARCRIGAFLSPEERASLKGEIELALGDLR